MASKYLLRTNPALTTNIKLVISSDDKLYLESYDANDSLSDVKYKHIPITDTSYLSEHIPSFYTGLSADIAFEVKQSKASDTTTDYEEQYDDAYWAGADFIEDTWHKEEFEYTAPLWVDKNNLPSNFIVLRVDGAGAYNLQPKQTATEKGFKEEIVSKWKCVSLFDLSENTSIGKLLSKNFPNNPYMPQSPFELNIKQYQFSKWHGIEYKAGGFCSKSFFMDETLRSEMSHYDLEEFITSGFRRNSVIVPHLVNMKFLFDDTPGNVKANRITERRTWSINRYLGFYLDNLELVKEVSPYKLEALKSVKITNNVFLDSGDNNIDPFVNGFLDGVFVKYGDKFLSVQKSGDSYIVIDDVLHTAADITAYFNLNPDVIFKTIGTSSVMEYSNGNQFSLTQKDATDLYLIEINGTYHVLTFDGNNNCILNSDWSILTDNKFIYQSVAGEVKQPVSFLDDNKVPVTFKIYRAIFTDIQDLDFERLNTEFSHYEYELTNQVNNTLEPKLYVPDRRTDEGFYAEEGYQISIDGNTFPNDTNDFYIPSSTEYASDESLWTLKDNALTSIWDKNQWVSKWGYSNSISHADYAYKLNNSHKAGGPYNKTAAFDISAPSREYSNLDWFYTVGRHREVTSNTILSVAVDNPDRYVIQPCNFHSLEIEHRLPFPSGSLADGWEFWVTKYFDINTYLDTETPFDYFEHFFTQPTDFNGRKVNTKKYATFSAADDVNPPRCLFRGMNVGIYDTAPVKPDQTDNLNYVNNGNYEGYKFSVILSKRPIASSELIGSCGIEIYNNKIWKNILVYIYVYTPYNTLTNFESAERDTFYTTEKFGYDLNVPASDDFSSSLTEVNLTPSMLTLFNFINGINDPNYDTSFDNGIKYIVIEDKVKRTVLGINKNDANNTLDFILDEDVYYKEGDYVELSGCTVTKSGTPTSLDGTYAIQKVAGNIVTLKVDGVPAIVIDVDTMGEISSATPDIPFRLNITIPDALTVDTDGYDIESETANLDPVNNLHNVGSILTVKDDSKLIPSVYNKQPLARTSVKKIKNVNDQTVDRLLYRFSGYYDPIMLPVELFSSLSFMNVTSDVDSHVGNTFEADTVYMKLTTTNAPDFEVGDVLLITVQKSDLDSTDILAVNRFYKVREVFDTYVLLDKKVPVGSELLVVSNVYVYRLNLVDKNVKFDTDLSKFGLVRQIISKANPDGLPLKSTAPSSTVKPVYPMIDEYGMTIVDRFIFKSSWDDESYYQSIQNRF